LRTTCASRLSPVSRRCPLQQFDQYTTRARLAFRCVPSGEDPVSSVSSMEKFCWLSADFLRLLCFLPGMQKVIADNAHLLFLHYPFFYDFFVSERASAMESTTPSKRKSSSSSWAEASERSLLRGIFHQEKIPLIFLRKPLWEPRSRMTYHRA